MDLADFPLTCDFPLPNIPLPPKKLDDPEGGQLTQCEGAKVQKEISQRNKESEGSSTTHFLSEWEGISLSVFYPSFSETLQREGLSPWQVQRLCLTIYVAYTVLR